YNNSREQIMGTDPLAADAPFQLDLSPWDNKLARLSWPGVTNLSYGVLSGTDAAALTLLTNLSGRFPETEWFAPYTTQAPQVLSVPEGETVPGLIAKYQRSGLVEFAEPDYTARVFATPNDPKFLDGTLWGLNNLGQNGGTADADIDAPEGWDVLTSASNIVVAVLDTGVRYTHEDRAANMWVNPNGGGHGTNALDGTNDPSDENGTGHGTLVAGILGAVGNNGKGVTGVAWQVQIMA